MEIHPSARKHGVDDADITHAYDQRIVIVALEADADPPKILYIGADRAGNLLELVALELDDDLVLVIHAMSLRRTFHELLPGEANDG